jgi:hypothetical protein
MSSIDDEPSPAAGRAARARAPTLLGAALALLIGLAALALRAPAGPDHLDGPNSRNRNDLNGPSPASPPATGSPRSAATPSTGLDARAGVAARLREILGIREQAFARRDIRLLETVYTADCSCLRSGRAAIARLLVDRVVWRGRAIAVEPLGLERLTERMWIVVALFSSRAFRIEREDGTLIRAVAAERQRYRFLLVRPGPGGQWLLGDASLLEGGGP